MRDDERIKKAARKARMEHDLYDASFERKLKTDAKVANNRKLYLDGYRKGLQEVPLESFSDLVEENGKMVQRKDHRSFKAGYLRGLEELIIQKHSINHDRSR